MQAYLIGKTKDKYRIYDATPSATVRIYDYPMKDVIDAVETNKIQLKGMEYSNRKIKPTKGNEVDKSIKLDLGQLDLGKRYLYCLALRWEIGDDIQLHCIDTSGNQESMGMYEYISMGDKIQIYNIDIHTPGKNEEPTYHIGGVSVAIKIPDYVKQIRTGEISKDNLTFHGRAQLAFGSIARPLEQEMLNQPNKTKMLVEFYNRVNEVSESDKDIPLRYELLKELEPYCLLDNIELPLDILAAYNLCKEYGVAIHEPADELIERNRHNMSSEPRAIAKCDIPTTKGVYHLESRLYRFRPRVDKPTTKLYTLEILDDNYNTLRYIQSVIDLGIVNNVMVEWVARNKRGLLASSPYKLFKPNDSLEYMENSPVKFYRNRVEFPEHFSKLASDLLTLSNIWFVLTSDIRNRSEKEYMQYTINVLDGSVIEFVVKKESMYSSTPFGMGLAPSNKCKHKIIKNIYRKEDIPDRLKEYMERQMARATKRANDSGI